MNLEGSRILVTGGKGFVGKPLVKRLIELGSQVACFDAIDGMDITNYHSLERVGEIDLVYHLAAIIFVPLSWEHPRKVYEVNVGGTLNVLEHCRIEDVKRVVFASSYVYGVPSYLPTDEEHPVNPTNPYARSKVIAEELCRGYSEDYGLDCTILRPFNIYGPGQNINFLVPMIISQLKSGQIELFDAKPKRDMVYIDDVVDAYVKAGQYEGRGWSVFNIGSGKSYSIDEIVQCVLKIHGKPASVHYKGEERVGEIPESMADIKKAKDELGWVPSTELSDGLKTMVD